MTPPRPPSQTAHRIHRSLAVSRTSSSSSGHRERIGIEEGNSPRPQPSYLTCHPHSLPSRLLRPHLTRSMLLPLPRPPLYPPPPWSPPPRGHSSPPPWLRQVPNCSTRDCALYPSPRGFLSLLTYHLKPRAFAPEGARPISPAWRVRSEVQQGIKVIRRTTLVIWIRIRKPGYPAKSVQYSH